MSKGNIKKKNYLSYDKIQKNNFLEQSDDGSKFLYEQLKIRDESEELINLGTMDSIYYPGAVFKIKKFENEETKILPIHLKRNPISISADFSTSTGIDSSYLCQTINTPDFANVSHSIGELCQSIKNADLGLSTQAQIYEIFYSKNMLFKFGLNLSQIFAEIGSIFDFSKNDNFNYGIMIIKQIYFTISMSIPDKGIYDVFVGTKEEIDSEIGTDFIPVCCSCIYGRIAIVLIKTKMKIQDYKVGFNIGFNQIGVNPEFENKCKKCSTTYDFFIYGGSKESQKIISLTNISDVIRTFVNAPVDSPKCIGYKFFDIEHLTFVKFISFNKCIKRRISPILIKKTFIRIKSKNNEIINSAKPGDELKIEVEIHPKNATKFKTKYLISNEKYGYVNPKENLLVLFDDIKEYAELKISFQTIQKNEGTPHIIESSAILRIIAKEDLKIDNDNVIKNEGFKSDTDIFQFNDFCSSKNITSFIIPEGFKEIGVDSFSNNLSLVHLDIQSKITKINERAFSRCTSLQTIKIPNSLLEICNYSFWLCKSLIRIILPDGIKVIGKFGFSGCESLSNIYLPDSIIYIGDEAFANCSSIKSIKIPLETKEIRRSTFYGCSSLKSVLFHDEVVSIEERAFCKCIKIKSIIIPSKIAEIGKYVFSACDELENIYVPQKLLTQFGLFKSIRKHLDLPDKCNIHKR